MATAFQIGRRALQPGSTPYIVAEIGTNHNGDLALAKQLIEAAADAGADAVKFQSFHTEEFMADKNMTYEYDAGNTKVREPMYEMFKRLELPEVWHQQLQAHAHHHGVEFLSSAADPQAVDLLVSLGTPAIKLASEDLVNEPLLEHVGRRHVPVILSTGMADYHEIDRAVSILRECGCGGLLLLHCVSLYPTPDEQANLLRIKTLRKRYQTAVGYSDHTIGIEAALTATALGAVLIEKHFTLDRGLKGPDHAFSADPAELKKLTAAIRKVARQLGSSKLEPAPGEVEARKKFRRSVVAAKDIPEGASITREMLCLKRSGPGIAPHDLNKLIGKRARRLFKANEQLRWDELQ